MAASQPSEAWQTIIEAVGALLASASVFWWRNYQKGRDEEGDHHKPDIPAQAIGAGLISKAAGDAIVDISGMITPIQRDIAVIAAIAVKISAAADKAEILAEAKRAAREEIRHKDSHKDEAD